MENSSKKRKMELNRRKKQMDEYKAQLSSIAKRNTHEELVLNISSQIERKTLHDFAISIGLRIKYRQSFDGGCLMVFRKPEDSNAPHVCLKEDSIMKISEINYEVPVVENLNKALNIRRLHTKMKIQLTKPPNVTSIKPDIAEVRKNLPVFSYREDILNAIKSKQIVVITAETGSGKTTQVPQYILEDSHSDNKVCRIVMTQPKRIATESIAKRIADERGEELGDTVGFQMRMSSCVKSTTNLILNTSGYLVRLLTSPEKEKVFKNITHLILDEVHEREKQTDFLMMVLIDCIQNNPNLKLILMSATLDANKFTEYFKDCPCISIPGRCFDVKILYLENILVDSKYETEGMLTYKQNLTTHESYQTDENTLKLNALEAYEYTRKEKRHRIDHMLLLHLILFIHNKYPTDGSILVFFPGYEDIMIQKDLLENWFQQNDCNECQLFVLHSNVEKVDGIFRRMESGIRKILLSTNIAETSITVEDVVYVIDTGFMKQISFDPLSGSTGLQLIVVSKASARQRAGRAGRTRKGFCFRLYSESDYNKMQEFTTPEILRSPLTDICLNAKLASNLSIEDFLNNAMDKIPTNNIRESIKLLKEIGALDEHENITHLGSHLADMPVDCQFAKMLLYSILFQCVDPVIKIICALSVKNVFWFSDKIDIDQIQISFSEHSLSDHKMFWKLFQDYLAQEDKKKFCKRNGIAKMNLAMMENLQKNILRYLKTAKYINELNEDNINTNALKWEVIKSVLVAGLSPKICETGSFQIQGREGIELEPHCSSVVVEKIDERCYTNPNIFKCGAHFLVYSHRSHTFSRNFINSITLVPIIDLVLFVDRKVSLSYGEHLEQTIQLEWIKCSADEDIAKLLLDLRSKIQAIFSRFLTTAEKNK